MENARKGKIKIKKSQTHWPTHGRTHVPQGNSRFRLCILKLTDIVLVLWLSAGLGVRFICWSYTAYSWVHQQTHYYSWCTADANMYFQYCKLPYALVKVLRQGTLQWICWTDCRVGRLLELFQRVCWQCLFFY